ncbi:MAG TPA: transglycosylase SLT domain-containing protein [Candidatus Angelobacter sp.]|nr:transglycosylase SLT domain-containing protein [Candidatus Angelobacter sp.]
MAAQPDSPATSKKTTHGSHKKHKKKPKRRKKHVMSAREKARLRHMKRAFVASTTLKPMAQQLLENRSPQAYAGVEKYARAHRKDDAAPLAWLVLGYAHYLDKDYTKARDAWKKAEPLQPILGDYLDWLRASAWQAEGNAAEVLKILDGFEQRNPDSIHLHDMMLLYGDALVASGKPKDAIAYFEKHRTPVAADTELALALAYRAAGMKPEGADILRRIYFEMPASDQAPFAAMILRGDGEAQPSGTFGQRYGRAELLMRARHYADAVDDWSSLAEQAPPDRMADVQAQFATALYRTRKRDDAEQLFETVVQNTAAPIASRAQALYYLAEIARDKDDKDKHDDFVSQLRTMAPDSVWFQRALLSSGNMYMLKNDFETGAKYYAEIYERQQNGPFSPYAHWKTTWLTFRMGNKDEAKRLMEEQLAFYPSSDEVPAAIYWRGRIAEDEGDKPLARAYYEKLSENFRYFYYANLARERLGKIGVEDVGDPDVLDKLPPPATPPKSWDPPSDSMAVQKAQLLANAALYDFAVKELQHAGHNEPWMAESLAQVFNDSGSYIRAIEALKRAVPGYFTMEVTQIPRPVWEGLFPRPYWDELQRDAARNQLDPYLVASLIRQESEFNPAAISSANAMGLMQLLPSVGRGMAREMRIHHFSSDQLLTANVNLELGTRYFKEMVDHYGGQVEYALAAYNAGSDRVDQWRKDGNFKSVDEFVESIPFTQTREYVQAIMRNAALYRLLYPKG